MKESMKLYTSEITASLSSFKKKEKQKRSFLRNLPIADKI